ncbi:MAG: sugar ABC transporter substrate-binding protein [Sarcina sp.]
MKRFLAMALIAMTTVGFMACGGKDTGKDTDKDATGKNSASITVQVEESWMSYYEEAKERVIAKYPDATIDFIQVGSFDHLDTIDNTDSTNVDVADVFALPLDRLYKLANNNVLSAIDSKAMAQNVGGFKDFDAGIGGNLKVDGAYLAFPYNIETLVGYVNKENAKKAGIDTSKNIEFTQLEYEDMLTLVHDAWFGVAFANSAEFELLAKDKDGKLISDAVKPWAELSEDEKGLFEGLYDYWKKHDTNKTDLWDKTAAGGYLDAQFKTGEGNAIRIDGPWAAPALTEAVGSEENLEVIALNKITVNGKPLNHWKGGWGLGVNSRVEEDAEKMELSVAMIEEIVNPKFAQDLFEITGKILGNVEPSAYEGIDPLNKKVIDATYESYEKAVSRPLFTEWDNVWATWQNALLSWSSTQPKNAQEAYEQVKASFEAMMKTVNK